MPTTHLVNLQATAFAGVSGAVVISGLSPSDTVTITKPAGLTYESWSAWSSDGSVSPTPPPEVGKTWGWGFAVSDADDATVHSSLGEPYYATSADAFAAAQASGIFPLVLTGSTAYKFWVYDPNPGDNRGGLSLHVSVQPYTTPTSPLPEIQMPAGIQFSRQPYDTEPVDLYVDVPVQTGEWRKRRVYTSAPNLVRVECFLTPLQAAAFHTWFEEALLAGQEPFTARMQKLGVGLEYWSASFFSTGQDEPPYRAEAIHGGFWRVSALLRTSGQPSTTPPILSTMDVEFAIPLESTTLPDLNYALEAEAAIELESSYGDSMDVEVEVPLDAVFEEVGVFRITEFGEQRHTEGGVFRTLEE